MWHQFILKRKNHCFYTSIRKICGRLSIFYNVEFEMQQKEIVDFDGKFTNGNIIIITFNRF